MFKSLYDIWTVKCTNIKCFRLENKKYTNIAIASFSSDLSRERDFKNDELIGVLDIDSPLFSRFNETDKKYLEKVIGKLVDIL